MYINVYDCITIRMFIMEVVDMDSQTGQGRVTLQ